VQRPVHRMVVRPVIMRIETHDSPLVSCVESRPADYIAKNL
jgi:hypothetical protein